MKKKYLSFLMLALCLMLAMPGLSEGETSGQAEQQKKETMTVGPSESVYPHDQDKGQGIDVQPSEIYYPEAKPTPSPAVSQSGWTNNANRGTNHGSMVADGIIYQLSDGIITVIQVTNAALNDGALVIPGKLANYNGTVQYIYANAFKDVRNELTSVELPGTITFIWNDAFAGCSALKTIRFHGSEAQWNALALWLKLPEGCAVEFIGE